MKIAIDIRALSGIRTGIGRYLLMMLKALASIDNINEYVLFYNSLKGEDPGEIPEAENFKTVRIRLPNKLLNVAWAFSSFPSAEMFVGKVDIFHSPNFQMAPVREGAKVLTIHDLVFYLHPEMAIPSSVRHFRPRIRHYLNRTDIVVADSEATANEIVEHLGISAERVEVVYPGTISMRKASENEVDEMKNRYGIDGDYILFVGCLEPRKNLGRLFQAFDRSGLWKDLSLVLAGPEGWHYEKLEIIWNSLKSKDKIRRLNYVFGDDLSALYSGAAFLAYPSLIEGFGLPILEAMSVGCPVLTSKVSSMPEVAGDAALYVGPEDIDSIVDGLKRMASDSGLRHDLALAGNERAKVFTWERTAEKMISIYKRAHDLRFAKR